MCCLFGILDCENRLTGRQKSRMLSVLAAACEARGTDATGIAYNAGGRLRIYKRPLPAHRLRFSIPNDTAVVMGHTRMATQGSEKRNYNNHPFRGRAGGTAFALAHNGVLHNDHTLRQTLNLPATHIETDSYVAVQLIQQKGALSLDSLKDMAEQVEGSFAFTLLDERDNLYFVKGNNPLCIRHFPKYNLYLYASTKEILTRALNKLCLPLGREVETELDCGGLLRVGAGGKQAWGSFDTGNLFQDWFCCGYPRLPAYPSCTPEREYLRDLKAIAATFGCAPEAIDSLLRDGFTTDELEEMLYCGEL